MSGITTFLILVVIVLLIILLSNLGSLRSQVTMLLNRVDQLNAELKKLKDLPRIEKPVEVIKEIPKIVPEERPVIKEEPRPVITEVKPPVAAEQPPVIIPPPPPVTEPPVMKETPQETYKKVYGDVMKNTPPVAPPKKKSTDLEKFIGEKLITFIGIGILVAGIAFFVKYAIDKNWINEIGRTAIGVLAGGILIGIAHRLQKSYRTFSSVLVGGGIAALYFTITYAYQVYHLFSQPLTLGILVVFTIFTVILSLAYDRKELAILAVIGGFASPLMITNGQSQLGALCTYMLVLNLGMLVLAYFKKWPFVTFVCYGFTILLLGGALYNEVYNSTQPQYLTALLFLTAFYLVFFGMNIISNVRTKKNFSALEILSLLSNTCLYYGTGFFLLQQMGAQLYQGLFTLLVGVFNFVFAVLLYRRQNIDRNLIYYLLGIVLTAVSLAAPVQLDGNYITMFWAAEATILLWMFRKSGIRILGIASVAVSVLALINLIYSGWFLLYLQPMQQSSVPDIPVFFNQGFITGIVSVASLFCAALILRGEPEFVFWKEEQTFYRGVVRVAAGLVLYGTFFLEFLYQMRSAGYLGSAIVVFLYFYHLVFLLAAAFWIYFRKWSYAYIPLLVLILFTATVYPLIPHLSHVKVRNEWLQAGTPSAGGAFAMHWLNAIGVIGLLVWLHFLQRRMSDLGRSLRPAYYWIASILAIFIITSEADHIQVNLLFFPQIPNKDEIIRHSRDIVYPIIWVVCSFVLIFIGLRKQLRPLRIIALALFFISIVKLIVLGISGASEAGKIIAFISSGAVLLIVAFMYQRIKKLFSDDSKTTDDTPLPE